MNNKPLFALAALGLAAGLFSVYYYGQTKTALPPVFKPAANPYPQGIYANGIIESVGASGENINIYPEVSGPITQLLVAEGQTVAKGTALLTIDPSVQRATTEQLQAQADAAQSVLRELKAEPRPETLAVAAAQVATARTSLKTAEDAQAKQDRAFAIDPRAISRDVLDNARNATRSAAATLALAQRQYDLARAGAWSYDMENQERQYLALSKAAAAGRALLAKYTLVAPIDGIVLAVRTSAGSYVSSQGAYNTYTEGYEPLIVMGAPQNQLQVRAYVDEILIHQLAEPSRITAQLYVRGTEQNYPLRFERIQPYVSPKIELSDARNERVDVRVLPVIFRFDKPASLTLFPGQLVDVYIGGQ